MGYNIIFTFIKLYLPGRKKNKMNEDLLVIKKNEVPAIQFNKGVIILDFHIMIKNSNGISGIQQIMFCSVSFQMKIQKLRQK